MSGQSQKVSEVPGRKTDILDCQWLQTLHSYDLLCGSFHPVAKIAELRSYMPERDHIFKDRSRYIQRMQKPLTKMNLLLHNIIDDITGKSSVPYLPEKDTLLATYDQENARADCRITHRFL